MGQGSIKNLQRGLNSQGFSLYVRACGWPPAAFMKPERSKIYYKSCAKCIEGGRGPNTVMVTAD